MGRSPVRPRPWPPSSSFAGQAPRLPPRSPDPASVGAPGAHAEIITGGTSRCGSRRERQGQGVTTQPGTRPPVMTRGLTLLFAVAGGAAVANLYWSQPLLDLIARDLHASAAAAGWLVTATQIGYAAGILLIVPLGDVLDRHRLIPMMMLAAAAALVLCAVAPSFPVLLVALAAVGVTTVSGQILTPLAGDLADDQTRGRVVGTVVSGILIGILLSRTISGLVAEPAGWRAIYVLAAVAAVVFAVLLHGAIPPLVPKTRMRYPALIASVGSVVAR